MSILVCNLIRLVLGRMWILLVNFWYVWYRRIFFVWEFSFPQLFSSHALFVFFVIYLLVLAWQSIIKLKLKLKQTIHRGPFITTLTCNCKVFLPLVKKCPCSLLGRKFGEAILLAGTLFLFFFHLSFFLSFFLICAQHLFVSSLLHNLSLRRHATLLRCVKTQRTAVKQTIASGRWPEILLTFFNIYLKIHLFGFFPYFQIHLKRLI